MLNLFSHQRPEWRVVEVANALDIPASTVSELMSHLAEERLLTRVVQGRYRLGWRLFELSQTLLDTTQFRIEARKIMEGLAEQWKETLHLAVLDGVQAVYIEKVQPKPAVKIQITRPGARLPAHSSGVGKTLLAYSEWEYIAELFEDQGMPKSTSNTITTIDALAEELERVRERGYAYDNEETLVGLCCTAAPIYNIGGEVVAAVSFSVPAYRFCSRKDEYTETIVDAARCISESASRTLEEYPN